MSFSLAYKIHISATSRMTPNLSHAFKKASKNIIVDVPRTGFGDLENINNIACFIIGDYHCTESIVLVFHRMLAENSSNWCHANLQVKVPVQNNVSGNIRIGKEYTNDLGSEVMDPMRLRQHSGANRDARSTEELALLNSLFAEASKLEQRVRVLGQRGVVGVTKLNRRIMAESGFLNRLKTKAHFNPAQLKNSNLRHLGAVVAAAEVFDGVKAVLHPVHYSQGPLQKQHTLLVDVVVVDGYSWVKVVARKAEGVHALVALGGGLPGRPSVLDQATEYLNAAVMNTVQYQVPRVVFYFYNGVSSSVAQRLEQMGVDVKCDSIVSLPQEVEEEDDVPPQSSRSRCHFVLHDESAKDFSGSKGTSESHGRWEEEANVEMTAMIPKQFENCMESCNEYCDTSRSLLESKARLTRPSSVDCSSVTKSLPSPLCTDPELEYPCSANLDVSTLITLVSTLSHSRCHFLFKEEVLTAQASEERDCPVLPSLLTFLRGRSLITCKSAAIAFASIVATLAGLSERARARSLFLGHLTIVPDGPLQHSVLSRSGRINDRSLVIFGTGEHHHAITVTANAGFVRAASQKDVNFAVHVHRPRALTEAKEAFATALPQGPPKVCLEETWLFGDHEQSRFGKSKEEVENALGMKIDFL
uniref:UPF0415 protein C7orf25 homolog isoform X2 n=1 Tax=Myxine glutinosa TaxID=7769 RepID=UPI00358E9CFA